MAIVTPLTDQLLDDIRYELADGTENFILPAHRLESNWQRAIGHWELFRYYCLRDLCAYFGRMVTAEGQDERIYNDSLYKHYKALLDDAKELVALLIQPEMQMGVIQFNRDYPPDRESADVLWWEI